MQSLINVEPLGEQELKLMCLIQELIKKRKYDDIPLLFTTGHNALSNVEMLPNMSMHLYKDVCQKHMTDDTFQRDVRLYKCGEDLLRRIAKCAPLKDFLLEMMDILGRSSRPHCLVMSTISVLDTALLRVPDDNSALAINLYEDCLDEIILRRYMYGHVPIYLLLGISTDIEAGLQTDAELQYFLIFHQRVNMFYLSLVEEICSHPRLQLEIFRCCKTNKRNMLCCFLIRMLEKPLALFDLRCSAAKEKSRCPVFFAVSLTHAITKCIGNPFFLLTFVEQNVSCGSRPHLINKEEDYANYFVEKLPLRTECLAIYFYMIIVEGIDAHQVPKVYNPLHVCEVGLHLVHYLLSELPYPGLQDKALRLATKLLTNLHHIKLPSIDSDIWIYKTFLSDLRSLVLNPLTSNVLMETFNAFKQFILCSVDDDKYSILKTLMATVKHPGACGYLINLYRHLAEDALKASSSTPISNIYSGQHFRAFLLENICKLHQGVKTDPAENNDQIEAALETILFFATIDTENRTGFWYFINEIQSQFTSPLRKAINFYESRFKAELLNGQQGRDMSGKKNRGTNVSEKDRHKRIQTLTSNLSHINILRDLLAAVCDSLTNSPIGKEKFTVKSNCKS